MVFSSDSFLVFLCALLIVYALVVRWRESAGRETIILASLVFYAFWVPAYLILLLGSIGVNFQLARLIRATGAARTRRWVLIGAVAANLGLLGYFKYLDLAITLLDRGFGLDLSLQRIILPIGISFFTFQQISFLVDQYRGRLGRVGFLDYALLIAFFPHLIAGPIVLQSDLLPQIIGRTAWRLTARNFVLGVSIFSIGLFKKLVFSDPISRYSDHIFAVVTTQGAASAADAWAGALSYAFQIYFDFSGYSDMAVGLACLFGFRLPINFFSPYRSVSIREFWRRWHITLSNFLRDYLYIPLGGSRHGTARTVLALLLTMALGGLWHGAGLNYVVWGVWHGAWLAAHHLAGRIGLLASIDRAVRTPLAGRLRDGAAVVFTCAVVVIGWVFFRAPDLGTANILVRAMLGVTRHGSVAGGLGEVLPYLLVYAAVVWLAPNSVQMFRRFAVYQHADEYLRRDPLPALARYWTFEFRPAWALLCSAIFSIAWFALSDLSPFIYFQF